MPQNFEELELIVERGGESLIRSCMNAIRKLVYFHIFMYNLYLMCIISEKVFFKVDLKKKFLGVF